MCSGGCCLTARPLLKKKVTWQFLCFFSTSLAKSGEKQWSKEVSFFKHLTSLTRGAGLNASSLQRQSKTKHILRRTFPASASHFSIVLDCHRSPKVTRGDFSSPALMPHTPPLFFVAAQRWKASCTVSCASLEWRGATVQSVVSLRRETAVGISLREGAIGDDCRGYASLWKMRALWKGGKGELLTAASCDKTYT